MNTLRRWTRRPATLGVVAAVLLGSMLAGPPAAYAVPPANDDIADAVPITAVPFVSEVDTSEATAVRRDGECVGGASVWYRFRPETTQRLRAVTVGSDFDTLLAVFEGRRAARRLAVCSDDAVNLDSAALVRFRAGQRYWIAVSSCCSRRTNVGGGDAVLTLYRGEPAGLTVEVETVQSGGVSGRLLVSGTAECNTPSLLGMRVRASQRNDDVVARGAARIEVDGCTGEVTEWTARINSRSGWAFRPGTAVVGIDAFVFDGFDLEETSQEGVETVVDNPDARPAR